MGASRARAAIAIITDALHFARRLPDACPPVARIPPESLRIDKKPRAGARPHTTGLIVKEAAEAWDIPARLTRKIRGVPVYGPSLAHLDLESPGYYFLATDTAGVLDWLAARAEKSGARLRFGTAYRGAAHEAGSIALTETNIRTRYLVGADGPRSSVAAD